MDTEENRKQVFLDFQGLWATEENLLSVFLGVHSPSFPPPSFTPSSSVRWRRTASASLLACARPLPCRFPPLPVSPGRPASFLPGGVAPSPATAAESPTAWHTIGTPSSVRSEERRVGKECISLGPAS